jgi:DNA-binding MarR family transcriptional regulator
MGLDDSVLDGDEIRRAVRVLTRLARVLRRAETGLTMPQYKLLVLLDNGDERSSQLAARLAVSKPTLTAAADGLVEAGFLRRTPDATDKRAVWLQLTEPGRAALGHADAAYAARFGPLLSSVSDPRGLVGMLDEIAATLDGERNQAEARTQQQIAQQTAQRTDDEPGPATAAEPDNRTRKKKVPAPR